jgi:hypothetical protein
MQEHQLDRLATLLRLRRRGLLSKPQAAIFASIVGHSPIRELEEFFGVELVRRKGAGLTLTDHGGNWLH